jgi:hypothetical protein
VEDIMQAFLLRILGFWAVFKCLTWKYRLHEARPLVSIKFTAGSGGAGCYNNVDISLIGAFTRENVARWLEKVNGAPDPFPINPVQDFYAVCGNVEIPWATEEARLAWENSLGETWRGQV